MISFHATWFLIYFYLEMTRRKTLNNPLFLPKPKNQLFSNNLLWIHEEKNLPILRNLSENQQLRLNPEV